MAGRTIHHYSASAVRLTHLLSGARRVFNFMSSTNRKNASERHVADYYVTPILEIKNFLNGFNEDYTELGEGKPFTILDPCAGGDANHPMSYPTAIERYSGWKVNGMDTIDVRPDSLATFKEDYLFKNLGADRPYDMAITNPPFNIAIDVIQKCLHEVAIGGWVIMLLRLNFYGSQERSAWFKQNMPTVSYIHSKRLSFTDDGKTDSIEYQHCCWKVGDKNRFAKLRIL